jgi:hypothetical protein
MRLRSAIGIFALLILTVSAAAQGNRGNTQATIKGKTIKVNYGRPALQGRDMLSMAKVGMVWRLGMDDATEIETTGDLTIGGKDLKAGKYTLWAKKTGDTAWTLAFHPTTGVWGVPELTSGYVAEMPLTLTKASAPAERLTINLAERSGNAAITIHWGTTQLDGNFGVK